MNTRPLSLLMLLPVFATSAFCYTSKLVGVDSNFLIASGKVFFAQSDGTLTALHLDTGAVAARSDDLLCGGTLQRGDNGLLVCGYDNVESFLDWNTLQLRWQVMKEYAAAIEGERLLSDDGNGLVTCRELATGKALWSYKLPGALKIVVQQSKVLLFNSAEYDDSNGSPTVVLLDLATGRELLHKTAPANVHYRTVFFDGERIYLATGTFKSVPRPGHYDEGRSSMRVEKLLVWDLAGTEAGSLPVPAGIAEAAEHNTGIYPLGDKVFAHGRVWKRLEDAQASEDGRGRPIHQDENDFKHEAEMTRFDLHDGTVDIATTLNRHSAVGAEPHYLTSIALNSAAGHWRGQLPYLTLPGKVVRVAATDTLLLLGTDLGHVEAIRRTAGQSQWMYIFSTERHTMSYSSYCMPPMMADAAKNYKRMNQNKAPASGLILEGQQSSRPRIIFDPAPTHPYRMLPVYVAIAWTGAVLPLVLSLLIPAWCRKKLLGARIPAVSGVVLAGAACGCLLFYGRVSFASALALRFALAVPLLVALRYSFRAVLERHRVSGIVLLLVTLGLVLLVFPAFLRL